MKFILSGSNWMVCHVLPREAHQTSKLITELNDGTLFGSDWIPAIVPGDVQSDAVDAGLIPPIEYGFNARAGEWTYQRDWIYYRRFKAENLTPPFERKILKFEGVDYSCEVMLNGKWLGSHEVAWTSFEFDVTDVINEKGDNHLIVVVKNAPDAECQWGTTSKVTHLKARFAYGWDWCTRMVPIGIWRDVFLEYVGASRIDNLWVRQNVDYVKNKASINANITISSTKAHKAKLKIRIASPTGKLDEFCYDLMLDKGENILNYPFDIDHPQLWYPNGYGEQPLYSVEVSLYDNDTVIDEKSAKIGLRHIEWLDNDSNDKDAIKYLPQVNGKKIFLKGYNIVPINQLYGREHKADYERRCKLAKAGNANFMRVWGGGLPEREYFYDLCDELGLLVMQELCQSSASVDNHPSMNGDYVNLITKTAEFIVKEKRNHPSLIVWCGGNELCTRNIVVDTEGNELPHEHLTKGLYGFVEGDDVNPWIPLSPEFPTLKALGDVVNRLDPDRKWLHTSGSGPRENANLKDVGKMHDVHGPWMDLGPTGQCEFYNNVDMLVHMEFGCDGAASMQALNKFMPKNMMWPMDSTNPAAFYHGKMWTETNLERAEAYFGKITNVNDYVMASRYIQAGGLAYAVESHRRRKWRTSGAVIWHQKEAWPNVSDTCTIDYYLQPKPAHFSVARAFRNLHISAKYDKINWNGEKFKAEIFIHNSNRESFQGDANIKLITVSGKTLFEKTVHISCVGEATQSVATVELDRLPVELCLLHTILSDTLGNEVSCHNSLHSDKRDAPYSELFEMKKSIVSVKFDNGDILIKNEGDSVVTGLFIETPIEEWVYFNDNHLTLLPSEEKKIEVDGSFTELYISGFGMDNMSLKH